MLSKTKKLIIVTATILSAFSFAESNVKNTVFKSIMETNSNMSAVDKKTFNVKYKRMKNDVFKIYDMNNDYFEVIVKKNDIKSIASNYKTKETMSYFVRLRAKRDMTAEEAKENFPSKEIIDKLNNRFSLDYNSFINKSVSSFKEGKPYDTAKHRRSTKTIIDTMMSQKELNKASILSYNKLLKGVNDMSDFNFKKGDHFSYLSLLSAYSNEYKMIYVVSFSAADLNKSRKSK